VPAAKASVDVNPFSHYRLLPTRHVTPQDPPMPFARVNGQKLFYEDTGGTGPAVIFSHGLFMDHEMFAPQVEALSERYRCITWDERGHGQTAGDTLEPFSYYDSADDVAALLAHLGIEQAVLAGMSQGGFLSMRCALTHPDKVRALILIDTQAGVEDPAKMAGYEQLLHDWTTNGLSDAVASIIEGIILGENWPGAAYWKDKWRAMRPVNVAGCFATLSTRDDITSRISAIKVPTLVIHGDADAAIPLDLAEVLVKRITGAQLAPIPGAGHAANLTHPAPTNIAIAQFLDRLGAT
jgi:pimeloyl-ACP methyl ester carboxylesterase